MGKNGLASDTEVTVYNCVQKKLNKTLKALNGLIGKKHHALVSAGLSS